jgi:hypothetical protein
MRVTHTRFRRPVAVVALATALATAGTATLNASAASPEPPINDNYLSSLNLNEPGKPLNREDTLSDKRNTAGATVQSDILGTNPGPAELTGCKGVSEGKTVWYDFYPDANGLMRVRTSAIFPTVMAIMPFNTKTLLPENNERMCAINEPTMAGELFDNVQAGKAYTVQVGGVGEAGGELEILFDYLVAPKHIEAEATLTAQPLANGVRVVGLSVSAHPKAHVEVRCTHGCGPQTATAKSVSFLRLRGAVLPRGSALKIYVTAKNDVGAYIEYKIGRGSFKKVQRCLAPGTKKLESCE